MTILPSSTSTLSHWNLCVAISSFAKSKNKMLVWQITDYIFTAAANLLLGGYTSALTIIISIIRNRLMIKKENDQDYFVHPHYSSNHRRILISINLGLLAICQSSLQSLIVYQLLSHETSSSFVGSLLRICYSG